MVSPPGQSMAEEDIWCRKTPPEKAGGGENYSFSSSLGGVVLSLILVRAYSMSS